MSQSVLLAIAGTQTAPGSEPETIELTTLGALERTPEAIILSYQETDLTGLAGTTTLFRIEPGRILLQRTGTLESTMEFIQGQWRESLYRIEGGALLLRVHARRMEVCLDTLPGHFDLSYGIEIEGTPMGTIDYHITVRENP